MKPVRVDVTLWLDGSGLTDVHVHEDAEGDGPVVPWGDVPEADRVAIRRRLRSWVSSFDELPKPRAVGGDPRCR